MAPLTKPSPKRQPQLDSRNPDITFADELFGPVFECHATSSLPSYRGSLFARGLASQKKLPLRPAPSSHNPANVPSVDASSPDTPALRQHWAGKMATRTLSPGRHLGTDLREEKPGPSSQRKPSPSTSPKPRIKAEDENLGDDDDIGIKAEETGADEPAISSATERPTLQCMTEDMVIKDEDIEAQGGRDGGMSSVLETGDGVATPTERIAQDPLAEAMASPEPYVQPDDDGYSSSDSDSDDEAYTGWIRKPDDGMIYKACDQVLEQAFGVQLNDLASVGAASMAFGVMTSCLAELYTIVLNSALRRGGIRTNKSVWGSTGSGTIPIRPARGKGDNFSINGGSGGGGNRGGGRKRSNAGHDDTDSDDDGEERSSGRSKRAKVLSKSNHGSRFSCPFRKRNPLRFNLRDSPSCALMGYPDISQVKRHIKRVHRKASASSFLCPRCEQDMGSQAALTEHAQVQQDQVCSPSVTPVTLNMDPEDGITSGIHEALNDRKGRTKVHTWNGLWNLLFPADPDVLDSDFILPTELDEVYAQLNSDGYITQLRQRVQEELVVAWNVDSMLAVIQSHINSVFAACRQKPGCVGINLKHLLPETPQALINRTQPDRFAPPASDYQASPAVDLMTEIMSWSIASSPGPSQVDQPAPGSQIIDHGFQSHWNMQNYLNHPGGDDQMSQQPRLQSMDSGVALDSMFSSQQAVDFSTVSPFPSQYLVQDVELQQQKPELLVQTAQQQDMQGQLMPSPEDLVIPPAYQANHYVSTMDNEWLNSLGNSNQWMGHQ
ncbi:hypothetical protein N0V88_007129 [Collariella sp. IMI 366227]|nr:hypothetical protein N0V88_007129 [Collariella sp. IMI 366227]